MEVTPDELRHPDLKESFRGYHRDDVDSVLESAAATIEHLDRQLRGIVVDGEPPPRLTPRVTEADLLSRALVTAQRAADETVTEANARADRILRDAEQRAQTLVGEAEMNARRLVETERRRRAEELDQLGRRCDELRADAAALDQYVSRYRSRVRDALETELSAIGLTFTVEPPSSRPDLHDVRP